MTNIIEFEPMQRLSKDLRKASKELSPKEARYLVDTYYNVQEYRKAAANQVRAMTEAGEPNSLIQWLFDNMRILENDIKSALNSYTDGHPVGAWAKTITGIGPIISAGLLAHIDITKAPTVGSIWRFAGLDPTAEWKKGQKRPWNARLKTLAWKIGQSFVKVSNNPKDFYGKFYKERKAYEQAKNEAGDYAEQAAAKLEKFRIGKDTDAYKWYSQGKLPPAHIQQRAERYATKLFLAHWHEFAYENHYGVKPPKPYAISILGHGHEIKRPG